MKIVILLSTLLVLSGCLYTKNAAINKFGCKPQSLKTDSITSSVEIDSGEESHIEPPDTIIVNGPCEELANMKPGESKTQTGKRTTATFGKDSTGNSYFICRANEFEVRMKWYRERWKETVYRTQTVVKPIENPWYDKYWWVIGLFISVFIIWLFRG
jgi:hypothetical protein